MPTTKLKIFVSSAQKEFAKLRLDLKAFLLGDAVLRRFISEVFLFEELPAKDRRTDQVYLEQVERCDIYLGIFGYDYGSIDATGLSATEREYKHATKLGKTRLIYVWGADEKKRDVKMKKLVHKIGNELIRRRVENSNALTTEVYASLVDYLDDSGALRVPPFDTAACDGASFKDLSRKRIDWFLETARSYRNFPLKQNTTTQALLTHLNLLADDKPTNAAMLLFGTKPQRFHITAQTKCIHCHGTEYQRPFAMQVYDGDLFEQANQALDFVLGKINRTIGTRTKSNQAPAVYELPSDAIAEAIINAIAHRDYHSNASVEVRLFADRLEVWNPGSLPGTLTFANLREAHPSVPNNPLIAESLYLTRYIERAGSGTKHMIDLCRDVALPEPQFEQRSGSFVITLWRDWLTDETMVKLSLNHRQKQAVLYIKTHNRITNSEYQESIDVSRATATRDLDELVTKGILQKIGTTGKGTYYVFAQKRIIKDAKES